MSPAAMYLPTPAITPRPYQREAVTACLDASAAGLRRILLALPTGTGKTIVFGLLLQARGGRSLVLAHRDELIAQAVDKLSLVAPTLDVGVVQASEDATAAQCVVASVQTLSQPSRLARLVPDFHTIVIDEAHHAPAATYCAILDYCHAWQDDGPLVVGVTATPERHNARRDTHQLVDVFEAIVYQKSLREMVEAGYLCPIRAAQVRLDVDFGAIAHHHGDFDERSLGEAMTRADAPRHVLAAFQAHAASRKALCFTPTITTAHAMAEAFQAAGIAAVALDGTMERQARRALLQAFHHGDLQVVCNCGVLTEGYDEPSIDCIIMARPTSSRPLYQQMLGRGTRISPGKADLLVLDMVGISTTHRLQQLVTLWTLDAESAKQRPCTDDEHRAGERAPYAPNDHDGALITEVADLFARRPLAWVYTRRGNWVMGLADAGTLQLTPCGEDLWQVLHALPAREKAVILHQGLPLPYAQGAAEDVARQLGREGLVDARAPWRFTQASEKQLAILRKWGIDFAPTITKGDAATLIMSVLGDIPRQKMP